MYRFPNLAINHELVEQANKTVLPAIGVPLANEDQDNYQVKSNTNADKKAILKTYETLVKDLYSRENQQNNPTKEAIKKSYLTLSKGINYFNNLRDVKKVYLVEVATDPLLGLTITHKYLIVQNPLQESAFAVVQST